MAAAGRPLEVLAAAEGAELTLAPGARAVAADRAPSALRPRSRARILEAEDEDRTARVLETALAADGYEVLRAADGAEAMRLAQDGAFDLILLDVEMPVMDGLAACRALRADPRWRDVPIVILTARGERDDFAEGFAHGATDFMTKPFAMSQFRARVRSWLMRAAGD